MISHHKCSCAVTKARFKPSKKIYRYSITGFKVYWSSIFPRVSEHLCTHLYIHTVLNLQDYNFIYLVINFGPWRTSCLWELAQIDPCKAWMLMFTHNLPAWKGLSFWSLVIFSAGERSWRVDRHRLGGLEIIYDCSVFSQALLPVHITEDQITPKSYGHFELAPPPPA